jgi:hypothetical protein
MRNRLKRLSWLVALGMIVVPALRAAAEGVVGTKKGKVFHTHPDDCSAAKNINTDNIVRWTSEAEAKKEGRRLCKRAEADERAKRKRPPSESDRPASSKRSSVGGMDEPNGDDAPAAEGIEVRVKKV